MATNTAGTNAREYHTHQSHYLTVPISYADGNGKVYTIGKRPANSLIVGGGVCITNAFNAGTANTLHIGTTGDDDGLATALALGTVGVIELDEMATTNDAYSATDDDITATMTVSGTAPTTGAGHVWVEYILLNRG